MCLIKAKDKTNICQIDIVQCRSLQQLNFVVLMIRFRYFLNQLINTNVNVNIKVGLSPSKKNGVICLIESPLKMMKNAFYFILKALFALKLFKFLTRLFDHVRKAT